MVPRNQTMFLDGSKIKQNQNPRRIWEETGRI